MLLEGSIRKFRLAHVLQLLAHTGATGVLEIRSSEEYGYIYLINGRVEGISLPLNDEKLGMRLLRAGYLNERQLAEALADDSSFTHEDKEAKPLGQRLVAKGFTTEARIREIVRKQASDWLFELVQWRDGIFVYEEPDEMPEFQVRIQADLKDLLREANQRIVENRRVVKTEHQHTHPLCASCPVASECSDEIKARYLKQDVCLWRSMSAVVDQDSLSLRHHHPPHQAQKAHLLSGLDSSLTW